MQTEQYHCNIELHKTERRYKMQTNLLKSKIYEKNLNVKKLSELMNMDRTKLSLRINGKIAFKLSELKKLKDILDLDWDSFETIFFCD